MLGGPLRTKLCQKGTVKLTSITVMCGAFPMSNTSSRCRGVSRDERARAQKSLMAGAKPMPPNREQVANDIVDRQESLGVCHRFEAPHVALALPRRLV